MQHLNADSVAPICGGYGPRSPHRTSLIKTLDCNPNNLLSSDEGAPWPEKWTPQTFHLVFSSDESEQPARRRFAEPASQDFRDPKIFNPLPVAVICPGCVMQCYPVDRGIGVVTQSNDTQKLKHASLKLSTIQLFPPEIACSQCVIRQKPSYFK